MRGAFVLVAWLAFGSAPLQCSREPEPDLKRYETPPDALHGLGERFKANGDQAAYRETLRYLVERYPNSRYAIAAQRELYSMGDAGARPAP